jgi:hypothetical protein
MNRMTKATGERGVDEPGNRQAGEKNEQEADPCRDVREP